MTGYKIALLIQAFFIINLKSVLFFLNKDFKRSIKIGFHNKNCDTTIKNSIPKIIFIRDNCSELSNIKIFKKYIKNTHKLATIRVIHQFSFSNHFHKNRIPINHTIQTSIRIQIFIKEREGIKGMPSYLVIKNANIKEKNSTHIY